jgi:lysophospholipase L1-like esterase
MIRGFVVPLLLAVLATPVVPAQAATVIAADHQHVRYQGRWGHLGGAMATVNAGSAAVLRFTGQRLAVTFDQATVTHPPQVYVRIDRAAPVLYTVDRDRIDLATRPGAHTLEITVKDVDERANRWHPPLRSALLLTGFQLAPGAVTLPPPAPEDRRVEFLGDSITQGVRAAGPELGVAGSDATKDYAWLTGKALRTDFRQVGFGAQGITRPGGGEVPPSGQALPFNFAGSPVDPTYVPDAVVVNQGTNDGLSGVDPVVFQAAYLDYLRQIRAAWPDAWIFAMRPLGGYYAQEIAAAASAVDRAVYVDTTGWVTATDHTDGLHPSYAGHLRVAHRLAPIIADRLDWTASAVPNPRVGLLAAGAAPGFESATAPGWVPGAYVSSVGVSTSQPYDGQAALQATSTVAPLGEWRTVSLGPDTRLRVPAGARDLFVYVSPDIAFGAVYATRLTVTQGGRTLTHQVDGLPHFGFAPWNRLHVNLSGNAPVTDISVSVRLEGTSTSGRLPFQVDDVGWTNVLGG